MRPGPTQEQLVATGFHRNTLINEEGGTDQEQFRVEAVVDRVSTTGAAFLGLTLGCARCHLHKYDPISHTEFYQLFALLNNRDEPTMEVPSPAAGKTSMLLTLRTARLGGSSANMRGWPKRRTRAAIITGSS